jgi:hypothetical protein
VLWEQIEQGNMRAMTIYFDRRFGKSKPMIDNEIEDRQFQIEVIDSRESLFKELATKLKFEDD